ncbi:MAG: hypothetical protein MUC29_07890, partial [Pyrinomonadaceae bacterium]|nr:hypothetical protein [Pyrinomonadaceae bacterium]
MQRSFCNAFCCALFFLVSASFIFAQKVEFFSDKYDSYDFNKSLSTENLEEKTVENSKIFFENAQSNFQVNPLATTNAIKITIDRE